MGWRSEPIEIFNCKKLKHYSKLGSMDTAISFCLSDEETKSIKDSAELESKKKWVDYDQSLVA